jgi:hypothetical protein
MNNWRMNGKALSGFCLVALLTGVVCGNLNAQAPQEGPGTRVRIVNGTSVEAIDLSLNGDKFYPDFRQGQITSDAATRLFKVKYTAENKATSAVAESKEIEYAPGASQTLVILGDFDVNVPPGTLRQPGPPPPKPEKPYPPSVLFRVYQHEKEDLPEAVRLRILNGMPGKILNFSSPNQKITVMPGEEQSLKGQQPVVEYVGKVDEMSIPILMRQEGDLRNATIVFFLKSDGTPEFKRVFEGR